MSATAPQRLTLASGGWLLIATLVLVGAVVLWSISGVLLGKRHIGDGATLESYGYDLTELRVPRSALLASGLPRDALAALDDPEVVDGRDVPRINAAEQRRKVVVSTERVLGVVVNGVARAYPMRILNPHEVVNDEIAGVPIAVTYSPLGDTAIVVRRDVAGSVRRFGVSGLLLHSTLVLYDRDEAVPSLWSAIERRAIAGPLVGSELTAIPGVSLTSWASWLAQHPETQIIRGDPGTRRRYNMVSYARYFGDDTLYFPVDPQPTAASLASDGLKLKSPVIALLDPRTKGRWLVIPSQTIVAAVGSRQGEGAIIVDGLRLRATTAPAATPTEPPGISLRGEDGSLLLTVPSLWFAWFATHPDATPTPATPALPAPAAAAPATAAPATAAPATR